MKDLFNVKNKVALVTGGSSGMGKSIAYALATFGAKVIISSNDEVACDNLVKSWKEEQLDVIAIPCDVSDKLQIQRLVKLAFEKYGKIDILVSGVGIAKPASFLDINTDDFEKSIQINLQSALYLTKQVLPKMISQNDGVLIYLSSIAGIRGNKAIGLYGITKAGLTQMVRNLAVEFGPYNIRANAISPGMIDTPFSESLLSNKEFMEKRLSLTPLRRVGKPDEIAGVALMLASRAGAFITGQNIVVDGGTTISDGN
jgi:NAD(P)-dependent dehydrogenase (short-subunit alcohol dehydrogenase family)